MAQPSELMYSCVDIRFRAVSFARQSLDLGNTLRMARLLWEERREEFDDRAEERRKVDEQSRTGDARIERGSALRRRGVRTAVTTVVNACISADMRKLL